MNLAELQTEISDRIAEQLELLGVLTNRLSAKTRSMIGNESEQAKVLADSIAQVSKSIERLSKVYLAINLQQTQQEEDQLRERLRQSWQITDHEGNPMTLEEINEKLRNRYD